MWDWCAVALIALLSCATLVYVEIQLGFGPAAQPRRTQQQHRRLPPKLVENGLSARELWLRAHGDFLCADADAQKSEYGCQVECSDERCSAAVALCTSIDICQKVVVNRASFIHDLRGGIATLKTGGGEGDSSSMAADVAAESHIFFIKQRLRTGSPRSSKVGES